MRSREQPWPVAVHITIVVIVAGLGCLLYSAADTRLERIISLIPIVAPFAMIAFDIARCRNVELAADALVVGGKRFAWADLHVPHFREVPIARAGMFVRVFDEARQRMRLPAPRHRDHGFGLAPAPNADEAAKRWDLFLRARGDRLVQWHDIVMVRMLQQTTKQLGQITEILTKNAASPLNAFIVSDDSTGITIQLLAPSIDALVANAKATLSAALPDDAKWNPQFARGVMVFVGPLSLGNEPGADGAIEHVKAAVKASVSGTPRVITSIWCEPALGRK